MGIPMTGQAAAAGVTQLLLTLLKKGVLTADEFQAITDAMAKGEVTP